MLSFNQQGAMISKVMSIDQSEHRRWGEDEDLDWLLNLTEPQVDHQPNVSVNVNYQQPMTLQNWSEHVTPVHQSFINSSGNTYQFSAPPLPVPAAHPHQITSCISWGLHGAAKSQHHARMTLVPNSTGGVRKIVKRKRKRTMFTTEQIGYLESVFSRKQYITREERQVIVDDLGLKDSSVKVWFQNRRIRRKRDEMEQADCESSSPSEEFYDNPSPAPLETMESKLFQNTDEFGYVTLDKSEMEVIVHAIDSVLSHDVSLEYKLEAKDFDQARTESESSSSIYEPISPAASDCIDEESSGWETYISPEQSLEKLFDLHFC